MNMLVIAAHPDDEVLGCGGTIAALSEKHNIHVLVLGTGITARGNGSGSDIADMRKKTEAAGKVLGVSAVYCEALPDQRFDTVPFLEIVKMIEGYIGDVSPDIILTHSVTDLNLDHTITARAVVTATRPMAGRRLKSVLSFEVPSSTEWAFGINGAFTPTVFQDVTGTIEKKILALKEYDAEMRSYPHPRSYRAIVSLAEYRGSSAGYHHAEAFSLVWKGGVI